MFFVLIPLLCPLLCTFVCANRAIRRIPTIIISYSRSRFDHSFTHHISTKPSIVIIHAAKGVRRTGRVVHQNRICNVVCLPRSFDHTVRHVRRAHIDLCYSVDKLLCCGTLLITYASISLSVAIRLRVRHVRGAAHQRSRITISPLRCRGITLFGPGGNFTDFLVPTILVLLLRRALLLNVDVLGTATHRGNIFRLRRIRKAKRKAVHLILNGTLYCLVLCALITACMLLIVPRLFSLMRVPRTSSLLTFIFPCLLTYVFFKVAVSMFILRHRTYVPLFIFSALPLLFVSNVS